MEDDDTIEECRRPGALLAVLYREGWKSGQTGYVRVIGYVALAKGFVVVDVNDGDMSIQPQDAIGMVVSDNLFLPAHTNLDGFRYKIGEKVTFPFSEDVVDENGDCMYGVSTPARVMHHINMNDNRWYVVFLEDHYVEGCPDNWWCAFAVCKEDHFIRMETQDEDDEEIIPRKKRTCPFGTRTSGDLFKEFYLLDLQLSRTRKRKKILDTNK